MCVTDRRFRVLSTATVARRKNDKPDISQFILRKIRNKGGRFLMRDGKLDLWFEIGDDIAREKTAQALRQRAPKTRKVLLSGERLLWQQEKQHRAGHEWLQHLWHDLTIWDRRATSSCISPR